MPASIVLSAIYGDLILAAAALGNIGFAVATFAINFAVSAIVTRSFLGKPKTESNSVRQQVPPSTDNRLPVVYGDAWLGGTFVDAVLSTDQQTMYYVIAVSHISPEGQFTYDTTKFYYGDRLVTFGTGASVASLTDDANNVDTKIAGFLEINLYTSNAAGVITTVRGSAPNVVMGGSDIGAQFQWPSSGRQMNGLAFAIVKLKYSTDAGTTGLQPLTFKVSHTLNGTGVAKPGSVLKDYLSNEIYGGAVPLANINTTACAALDTYSDQTIPYTPSGGGSATQARYRVNGVLDTGETVLNNIDHILTACDSWLAYQAETGQWAPIINKAESTSFAFNDSNIIGDIRVSATDITQSINKVEATFPFKGSKDQPGTVLIETPSNLLYPNEPENKYTTTFNLVNDSVQAQYLANRMLEQAREDLIVSFSTAYTGIQVNAGEVVSVTNASYGWTDKLFRVMKVTETSLPDGNLGARFELSEYNAQVYDDASITQFSPAPNSGISSGYYFPALTAPTIGDQAPNGVPPTFSVTCQVPSAVRVTTITLYYTTSTTPTQNDWKVWAIQTSAANTAFTAGSNIKFAEVSLPPGTYYFAFSVGNDVSISGLSPSSQAITWTPITADFNPSVLTVFPATPYLWIFGPAQSWTGDDGTVTETTGGLTIAGSSGPIFFYSPDISISGQSYTKVRMKVRRVAGSGWNGVVGYSTTAHGVGSGYTKVIPNPSLTSAWQTLEWDMTSLTAGGGDWIVGSTDAVLSYANFAAFPATGAFDKVYFAQDTSLAYRWNGSIYVFTPTASNITKVVFLLGETSADQFEIAQVDFYSPVVDEFGWTSYNCNLVKNYDYLSVDATGNDPAFVSPAGIEAQGAANTKVRMKIKRTSGAGWVGKMYYATGTRNSGVVRGFNENYVQFSNQIPPLNQWCIIEWNMDASATPAGRLNDWSVNTIYRLRFDLGATSADDFQIEWISVGSFGPVKIDKINIKDYIENASIGVLEVGQLKTQNIEIGSVTSLSVGEFAEQNIYNGTAVNYVDSLAVNSKVIEGINKSNGDVILTGNHYLFIASSGANSVVFRIQLLVNVFDGTNAVTVSESYIQVPRIATRTTQHRIPFGTMLRREDFAPGIYTVSFYVQVDSFDPATGNPSSVMTTVGYSAYMELVETKV